LSVDARTSEDTNRSVPPAQKAPVPSTQSPTSAVETADSGPVTLESKGYIIPAHQILVSPKVSGMVEKLFIEEGQRVKKGEILAVLEQVDYAADVAGAEAALSAAKQQLLELETGFRPEEIEQANAELKESEAQLEQLKAEFERNERLKVGSALAERDYDIAKANYLVMIHKSARLKKAYELIVEGPRKERLDHARAQVKQAEANLVKAKWRLDNCTIRAPVSGVILRKNAEEGNIVNPIAFNGSYSLCELADLSDLEVELSIQERDVSRVFKGQRCRVRCDAYPERIYEGIVSRLMPIADRAKGAIPVRVKLTVPAEEEGIYLKPEMGAVVSFLSPDEPKESKP
jgi:multidrug resistance efflux pump